MTSDRYPQRPPVFTFTETVSLENYSVLESKQGSKYLSVHFLSDNDATMNALAFRDLVEKIMAMRPKTKVLVTFTLKEQTYQNATYPQTVCRYTLVLKDIKESDSGYSQRSNNVAPSRSSFDKKQNNNNNSFDPDDLPF